MEDITIFYILVFTCSTKTLFGIINEVRKGAFEVALLILGNTMLIAYSFVMLVRMLPHGQRALVIILTIIVISFIAFIVKEILSLINKK